MGQTVNDRMLLLLHPSVDWESINIRNFCSAHIRCTAPRYIYMGTMLTSWWDSI